MADPTKRYLIQDINTIVAKIRETITPIIEAQVAHALDRIPYEIRKQLAEDHIGHLLHSEIRKLVRSQVSISIDVKAEEGDD